ncbi:MAG: CDP-alcohol phosphatidyltransferase family protein [Candidatus Nitrosotenuis sp.]
MTQTATKYLKSNDTVYVVFVVDRLIRYLIPWISKSRLTPNQITLFTLFAYICSSVFFFLGSFVLAAVCFQLGFFFDCIDGKLARFRNEFSVIGDWLDTIVDRIGISINAFALGYHQSSYADSREWVWFFGFVILELLSSINGQYVINREMKKDDNRKKVERTLVSSSRLFSSLYRMRDWLRRHRLATPPVGTIEIMIFLFVFAPLFGVVDIGVRIAVILLFLLHAVTAFFYWRKEMLSQS